MISVEADFKELERALTDVMRRQLPFAMMMALNDTGVAVKEVEEAEIERRFDRPTPFTKRGVYVKRARKSDLTVEVGMKTVQAGYLRLQAKGGVRRPKRRALVIGVGLRRNKYGNLPRNAVKRAEAKGNTFVANGRGRTRGLAPGLYQRPRKSGSGAPKLLVSFKPSARYRKRFDFQRPAVDKARPTFPDRLVARLKEAQKTAR